jgi:TRAP-type transport system periplasmic protein
MRTAIFLAAAVSAAVPLAGPAAEPITLKLGFPPPSVSHFYAGTLVPWAKAVETATRGALKIQIYPGGTLASHRNAYDRVLNGVADIVFGLHGMLGNTFQKTTVTALPGILATGAQCTAAVWRLYTSGVIAGEYQKVHPLGFSCFPPTSIIARREIRSLDDMKGMKISVSSRIYGREAEILGAAPITLATPEIYQSMQRGLVDGAMVGMAAVAAYKLTEVAGDYFDAPMGQTTEYLLMNKASYEKLPEEIRNVFDKTTGLSLSESLGKSAQEESDMGLKRVEAAHQKVTAMADAELGKLRKLMKPVVDQWLKATPDGEHVLEAYRAELAKLGVAK